MAVIAVVIKTMDEFFGLRSTSDGAYRKHRGDPEMKGVLTRRTSVAM